MNEGNESLTAMPIKEAFVYDHEPVKGSALSSILGFCSDVVDHSFLGRAVDMDENELLFWTQSVFNTENIIDIGDHPIGYVYDVLRSDSLTSGFVPGIFRLADTVSAIGNPSPFHKCLISTFQTMASQVLASSTASSVVVLSEMKDVGTFVNALAKDEAAIARVVAGATDVNALLANLLEAKFGIKTGDMDASVISVLAATIKDAASIVYQRSVVVGDQSGRSLRYFRRIVRALLDSAFTNTGFEGNVRVYRPEIIMTALRTAINEDRVLMRNVASLLTEDPRPLMEVFLPAGKPGAIPAFLESLQRVRVVNELEKRAEAILPAANLTNALTPVDAAVVRRGLCLVDPDMSALKNEDLTSMAAAYNTAIDKVFPSRDELPDADRFADLRHPFIKRAQTKTKLALRQLLATVLSQTVKRSETGVPALTAAEIATRVDSLALGLEDPAKTEVINALARACVEVQRNCVRVKAAASQVSDYILANLAAFSAAPPAVVSPAFKQAVSESLRVLAGFDSDIPLDLDALYAGLYRIANTVYTQFYEGDPARLKPASDTALTREYLQLTLKRIMSKAAEGADVVRGLVYPYNVSIRALVARAGELSEPGEPDTPGDIFVAVKDSVETFVASAFGAADHLLDSLRTQITAYKAPAQVASSFAIHMATILQTDPITTAAGRLAEQFATDFAATMLLDADDNPDPDRQRMLAQSPQLRAYMQEVVAKVTAGLAVAPPTMTMAQAKKALKIIFAETIRAVSSDPITIGADILRSVEPPFPQGLVELIDSSDGAVPAVCLDKLDALKQSLIVIRTMPQTISACAVELSERVVVVEGVAYIAVYSDEEVKTKLGEMFDSCLKITNSSQLDSINDLTTKIQVAYAAANNPATKAALKTILTSIMTAVSKAARTGDTTFLRALPQAVLAAANGDGIDAVVKTALLNLADPTMLKALATELRLKSLAADMLARDGDPEAIKSHLLGTIQIATGMSKLDTSILGVKLTAYAGLVQDQIDPFDQAQLEAVVLGAVDVIKSYIIDGTAIPDGTSLELTALTTAIAKSPTAIAARLVTGDPALSIMGVAIDVDTAANITTRLAAGLKDLIPGDLPGVDLETMPAVQALATSLAAIRANIDGLADPQQIAAKTTLNLILQQILERIGEAVDAGSVETLDFTDLLGKAEIPENPPAVPIAIPAVPGLIGDIIAGAVTLVPGGAADAGGLITALRDGDLL
jgi:hypothetical protein